MAANLRTRVEKHAAELPALKQAARDADAAREAASATLAELRERKAGKAELDAARAARTAASKAVVKAYSRLHGKQRRLQESEHRLQDAIDDDAAAAAPPAVSPPSALLLIGRDGPVHKVDWAHVPPLARWVVLDAPGRNLRDEGRRGQRAWEQLCALPADIRVPAPLNAKLADVKLVRAVNWSN